MHTCICDYAHKVEPEMSLALGNGLKCGFLGLLHMEVFHQRLQDEFDIPVLLTTPQVICIYIIYTYIFYCIARSCVSEHHICLLCICIFLIIIIIIIIYFFKIS
jgi:hypothetical protein